MSEVAGKRLHTHSLRRGNRHETLAWGSITVLLMGVAVAVINLATLVSYSYFLLIAVASYGLLFKKVSAEVFWLWAGYVAVATGLYLIQLHEIPAYYGFSGGSVVGTDDCRFWAQVAKSGQHVLPPDCYVLGENVHNYSRFLRWVTVPPIKHPLDIILANVWAVVLLPPLTRSVTWELTNSRKAARAAFWFMLLCPFTLSNSLVLVRDGWVALALVGAVYGVVNKRRGVAFVFAGLGFFLRPGSGFLIVAAVGTLLIAQEFISAQQRNAQTWYARFYLLCVGGIVVAVVALYVVLQISGDKLGGATSSIFFRQEFMESYLATRHESSVLLTIMQLPAIARIPLAYAFFLAGPFFQLDGFQLNPLFVPRRLMYAGIFPIIYLAAFNYVVRGVVSAWQLRHRYIIAMFGILSILLVLVSQASMQYRHKVMLMPLIYVVAGYGFATATRMGKFLGLLAACVLFLIQLYMVI